MTNQVLSISLGILFLAFPSFAQEPTGAAAPQALSTYADGEAGLRQFAKDMLTAAKNQDQQRLKTLAESLLLPNPGSWFQENFDDESGPMLERAYAGVRDDLARQLADTFLGAVQNGFLEIQTHQFKESCDAWASEKQYPILAARRHSTPFYQLRLEKKNLGMNLWFFTYAEGGFRYLGIMSFLGPPPPSSSATVIRAERARLVKQVPPTYPSQARSAGIQGTVEMWAVIDREGRVQNLRLIQGRCWLAKSAMEAVSKWRYKPTLIDGQPVEVVTTLKVTFNLSR